MYTCVLNPSITDVEYARAFNDSWPFMYEQFAPETQEQARAMEKHKMGLQQTVVSYEDGYLLSIYGADIQEGRVTLSTAFYGYALDGTKNYLYDNNWLSKIQEVLNDYGDVFWGTVSGSSIDNHVIRRKDGLEDYYGAPTIDKPVTTGEVIYNVLDYRTK